MNFNKFLVLTSLVCIHLFAIKAYPVLNVRRLFDSAIEGRYKKSDLINAQTDTDVRDLENLKKNHEDDKSDATSSHPSESSMPASVDTSDSSSEESSINHSDHLPEKPEIQQQKELETIATTTPSSSISITSAPANSNMDAAGSAGNAGQPENDPSTSNVADTDDNSHRPPMLPHHDGGKVSNNNQNSDMADGSVNSGSVGPSISKPFYGAARLAFGQNPEILPTLTSSTSTSTTTTKSSESIASVATNESAPESSIIATSTTGKHGRTTTIVPSTSTNLPPSHSEHSSNRDDNQEDELSIRKEIPFEGLKKEEVGDLAVDQLEAAKMRRSVTLMPPKAAETLFKHKDGQYSSFDMAQYVFWTGDEAGVARAVEEFIQQGLMSRENAIKFLRDIRVGIEFLQNSYTGRNLPSDVRGNNIKKNIHTEGMTMSVTTPPPTTEASTTAKWTTARIISTTTTEKPFPRVQLDHGHQAHSEKSPQESPSLARLQEMSGASKPLKSEYDESAERAKIAQFLYSEYSLEEVIYQLAKVMFAQSLTHGSAEAQQELQKLTEFLEDEGKRGLISPSLQKKVLDVLLSALSDTLVEHPELLPAARANLGNSFHKIPGNALDPMRN